MTYFDSQNGWIQIAFANEEDSYILPSMISVNYQRYLFYCLKKAGYEAVYFWGDGESNLEITYMDVDSAKYYEKIRPQSFFEKYLTISDSIHLNEENEISSVKLQNEAMMEQLFYQIIGGKKKTALVVSIAVFDAFFSKNERAKSLLEKYRLQKSNKNLVLITTTARAEDSNRHFTNKEGILYKMFEEVRQAVSVNHGVNMYESLQGNMGEKCMYLNELNRDTIRNIVRRRMMLDAGEGMPMSQSYLKMVTLVIEWYYHSKKFQTDTPINLPENKKREQKVIDKSLQNLRTMEIIRTWIEDMSGCKTPESLKTYLKHSYPKDVNPCFIYTDNFTLRLWEQISIPDDMLNLYQKSWKRRMEELTERLKSIVMRGDEHLDKEKLDACMEQMKRGIKNRDMDSVRRGMNGVEFLLDNCYEREMAYEDIWKYYQKLFELSNEVYKLKIEIEDNQQRKEKLEVQAYYMYQQCEKAKETPGVTEAGLNLLIQKALQCDDEVNLVENVKILKENQQNQYQNVIETIENTIQSARSGALTDVQQVYEQALNMQKKMLDQNIQTIKEVVMVKEKQPELIETIGQSTNSTWEELEDRYRVLEAKMKQLV